MEKEVVPYEIALELKELGFDKPCFMFYEQGTSNKYLQKGIDDDYWGDYSEPRDWNSIPNKPWKPFCQCISVPLYQQAFRWFREKYGWTIKINKIVKDTWSFSLENFTIERELFGGRFSSYEEAELECLKKLIEIVKQQ